MADDENQSDSSLGEAEPPPAGDETEPAPAGESSSEDESTNKPLEDNEGHSDSSAETDGDSGSSSSSDSSSDSEKSSSDGSSSGDSSPQPECVTLTEDDIKDAVTSALQARDVAVDDDGVKVSSSDGLFTFMVRLTADSQPLPQVPDDTSTLAPDSVQGAMKLLQGSVQVLDGGTRVIMKVVSVETSEILEVGKGDASASTKDAVQAAAEDALAGCSSLGAT